MPIEEEEYELVPVGPLRRIEKRVEKIEKGGTSTEMVKELIDVVRTNQKIIDEVVKINSEMINKVSDLSAKVTELTGKMNDFLERVEVSEGETAPAAATATEEHKNPEMEQRVQKLEKRINALLLSTMKAKQLQPMVRRPMPA
jgi:DNA anti-recombination protein RmuC